MGEPTDDNVTDTSEVERERERERESVCRRQQHKDEEAMRREDVLTTEPKGEDAKSRSVFMCEVLQLRTRKWWW